MPRFETFAQQPSSKGTSAELKNPAKNIKNTWETLENFINA